MKYKILKGNEPQAAHSIQFAGLVLIQGRDRDGNVAGVYVTKDEAIRIMADLAEVTK